MKVCSYCGRENTPGLATCGECGTGLPDSTGNQVEARPAPEVTCPACGATDNYKTVMALHGSFSWVALLLGGFLAVFFHNASREKRVQCNGCGNFFGVRTSLSKVSRLIFWLLIAPTICVFLWFLVSLFLSI